MRLERSDFEVMSGCLADRIGGVKIRNCQGPFVSHDGSSHRVQCEKDDKFGISMIV